MVFNASKGSVPKRSYRFKGGKNSKSYSYTLHKQRIYDSFKLLPWHSQFSNCKLPMHFICKENRHDDHQNVWLKVVKRKHTNSVTNNGNNPKNIHHISPLMKRKWTQGRLLGIYLQKERIRTSTCKNIQVLTGLLWWTLSTLPPPKNPISQIFSYIKIKGKSHECSSTTR